MRPRSCRFCFRFLARIDGFLSQDLKKVRNRVPKKGEFIANSWNQTLMIASSEGHSLSIEEEEMLAVRSSDPGLAGLVPVSSLSV